MNLIVAMGVHQRLYSKDNEKTCKKKNISHVEMMSCFFWKLHLRYKRFLIYDTVVLSQVLLSIDVFISATAFLSSLLLWVQADIIKGAGVVRFA